MEIRGRPRGMTEWPFDALATVTLTRALVIPAVILILAVWLRNGLP